jgi:hypothetical protein
MFRTTPRRIAAALAVAVAAATIAVVLAVVLAGSSTATAKPHQLYHNFCPLTQADVAAAGPYSPSTQSDAKSIKP